MGRGRKVHGICRHCLQHKKLSFEHVPTEASGNDRAVMIESGESLIHRVDLDEVRGKLSQRGAGDETLCAECNSETGAYYGAAFKEFVAYGRRILAAASNQVSLTDGTGRAETTFNLQAGRVLKQIVSMFLSTGSEKFARNQPALREYVRDRESCVLDPRYRFYLYLNAHGGRICPGGMALKSGKEFFFAEIAFPPFGYVLTFDSEPPDRRLCDITCMAQCGYNQRADVAVRLAILPVYSWLPGDYDDRETVRRRVGQSP